MDQTNFKFYQADNVYGALFFQFPKVLMYGEQYRYLSSEAKLAYIAFFLVGIPTDISGILPGNQTGFLWFAALNIIEGIATPFFTTLLMAMIQQSYPAEELGRILGVLNSLLNLAGPIGLIFAGPLADVIGIERLFVIAGIGAAICGVVAVLMPITRQYDIRLHQKLAKLTEQPDK